MPCLVSWVSVSSTGSGSGSVLHAVSAVSAVAVVSMSAIVRNRISLGL